VIAPPLIVGLQLILGWRITFLIAGVLGFVWLVAWLLFFWPPEKHPRISPEELALIEEDHASGRNAGGEATVSTGRLLRTRQVWAIILGRLLVDPIWWLFVLWLPEYLHKSRGFSVKQIGMFAWAPYLAASAGSLFGGWLAGRLIRHGFDVNCARKTVIVSAAFLMPAGLLAARAESAMAALGYIAIVLFGFQMWISNVQTLPSDFFADKTVGSVAGLGGTGAAIGSMMLMLATGWIVTRFSYAPVLVTAGVLAPLGTAVLFALAGKIRRLELH
jgi:ACS family hexuronate transporter-like MFS transporter